MTDADIVELEARLRRFVVPATAAPLGSKGASYAIDRSDAGTKVRVTLGFPAARSGANLIAALQAHCAGWSGPTAPQFDIQTKIEAHAVQQGLKPLDGVSNLIAVASGKGGVGKSTVAANLSIALAQEGASVGLLDADIYGPSQPRMLGLAGRRPETRDGKTLEPLRAHGIQAMSIGFLVDERQPMAWRGPMVTSALTQLLNDTHWQELDYLLIDMPPGTGDIQLTLAQRVPVSGAVIVTTPQDIALADARKGLEMFQKVNVPILGVVENMSMHICSNCGHEEAIFGTAGGLRLAQEYGLPLLGSLPLDRLIHEHSERGVPTVAAEPDGRVAAGYREIALRAAGALAASGKDYSKLFPKITIEGS
ncbi:MAG TPA: iron-sulfur cluster carrier protein ApbC [Gammaproteobacteria bacterium]|nr:iron-sulfur cluster carrier protein ApbC [Gammaproteobacteria bacterium]